jgi:hypothetical protein
MACADDEERSLQLERGERRIAAHPGYKMHKSCEGLARSVYDVFLPNMNELMRLLDAAATDSVLAMELVQNAHDDSIRRRFQAEATRRLHNYVAGTMSLVEHARRLMRNRTGTVAQDFNRRKVELLTHAAVPFMMDLRVYIQHRALPVLAHSMSMYDVNTPNARFESEVQLSVPSLSDWDGWSSASRHFLCEQGDVVVLRPLVRNHGDLVLAINLWLYKALFDENRSELEAVNRLVVDRNAIFFGCSFQEAEAVMERTEQERRQPGPFQVRPV